MNHLVPYNSFINEVATSREDLKPETQYFQGKKKGIEPALLTIKEYIKLVDGEHYHPSDAYTPTLKSLNAYPHDDKELIQRKDVGGLEILFYRSTTEYFYRRSLEGDDTGYLTTAEMKERGLPTHDISLYAYHDGRCIGTVQDEWGATLLQVAAEYKGMGIGTMLNTMFRKIHPDRSSGGFTAAGMDTFYKVHANYVREYLRNGIYSDMLRKGEITRERVDAILNNVEVKNRTKKPLSPLQKYYKTKDEDLLLYMQGDNTIILFDSKLKELLEEDRDAWFVDSKIKAYIHMDYSESKKCNRIYGCGADSEQYASIVLAAAVSHSMKENPKGLMHSEHRNVYDDYLPEVFQKVLSKNFKETKEGKDLYYTMAKSMDFTPYYRFTEQWFKKFDKYGEFETEVGEHAFSKWGNK